MFQKRKCRIELPKVQVSDTTGDAMKTEAGIQNQLTKLKPFPPSLIYPTKLLSSWKLRRAGKIEVYFKTNPSKNFVLKSPLRKRSSCINCK